MSNQNRRRYRTRKAITETGRDVAQAEQERNDLAKRAKERAQNVSGIVGAILLCLYVTYIYLIDGIRLSEYLDPGDSQFWFGTVPIFAVVYVVLKLVERIARKYFETNE